MKLDMTTSSLLRWHFSTRQLAFWGLAIFVFTIPMQSSIVLGSLGTISRLTGVLAMGLGALALFHKNRLRLKTPSLLLLMLSSYVLWIITSFLWTMDVSMTQRDTFTMTLTLAMVWLIWQFCDTDRDVNGLLQAYTLGAYVSAANTAAQFLIFGQSIEGLGEARYVAAGFNPNYLASTLALAIPMAWYLAGLARRPFIYWLNLLYIPVSVFAIILTASRGGLIVAFIGLAMIPLSYARLKRWQKVSALTFLLVLVGFVYNALPDLEQSLQSNFERLSQAGESVSSADLTGRVDIWIDAYKAFKKSPYIGYGGGTFDRAIIPYYREEKAAHNAFVAVVVETGLVGLSLFVAMLVVIFLPMYRLERSKRLLYVTLFLIVLVSFIPSNWQREKQTWFIFGVITTQAAFILRRSRSAWQGTEYRLDVP